MLARTAAQRGQWPWCAPDWLFPVDPSLPPPGRPPSEAAVARVRAALAGRAVWAAGQAPRRITSADEAVWWLAASRHARQVAEDEVGWVWRERLRALLSWLAAATGFAAPPLGPREVAPGLATLAAEVERALALSLPPPLGGGTWARQVVARLHALLRELGEDGWRRRICAGFVVNPAELPSARLACTDLPAFVPAHLAPFFSRSARPSADVRRASPPGFVLDAAWGRRKNHRFSSEELMRRHGPLGRLWLLEACVVYDLGLRADDDPLPHNGPAGSAWLARAEAGLEAWAGRFEWAVGREPLPFADRRAGAALRAAVAAAVAGQPATLRALRETGWPQALEAAREHANRDRAGLGEPPEALVPAEATVAHGALASLARLSPPGDRSLTARDVEVLMAVVPRLFDASSGVPRDTARPRSWDRRVVSAVVVAVAQAVGLDPGPLLPLVRSYGERAKAGGRARHQPPCSPRAAAVLATLARGWHELLHLQVADLGACAGRAQVAALRQRAGASQLAPSDGLLLWCGVCDRVRVCVEECENAVSRRYRVHAEYSRLATHTYSATRPATVKGLRGAVHRVCDAPAGSEGLIARITCGDKGPENGAECNNTELSGVSLVGRAVFLGGRCYKLCVACGAVFRPTAHSLWSAVAGGQVCLPCAGPSLARSRAVGTAAPARRRAARPAGTEDAFGALAQQALDAVRRKGHVPSVRVRIKANLAQVQKDDVRPR